jgi:hypothetical protein
MLLCYVSEYGKCLIMCNSNLIDIVWHNNSKEKEIKIFHSPALLLSMRFLLCRVDKKCGFY